eukprot:219827-Pyramimonas_sp.AAC.1
MPFLASERSFVFPSVIQVFPSVIQDAPRWSSPRKKRARVRAVPRGYPSEPRASSWRASPAACRASASSRR